MKKYILLYFILFLAKSSYSQLPSLQTHLLLDMEITENGKPFWWRDFGSSNYLIKTDDVNKQNGKYAASIEYNGGKLGWRNLVFHIPNQYKAKQVKLEGYIKTENITEGHAGLMISTTPHQRSNNGIKKQEITGTTDWTKCELIYDLDSTRPNYITVGGSLTGNGKMWLDNLTLSLDGKEFSLVKPEPIKFYPAEGDREFDNGSNIENVSTGSQQIDLLKTLCLLWGFLKYYHPQIAAGNHNWDYELFRILPKLLDTKTQSQRDKILVKWIKKLGAISENKEISVSSEKVKVNPDLDWIRTENFSEDLTNQLLKIKDAKKPDEHYYVNYDEEKYYKLEIGKPTFEHEKFYIPMIYHDQGFRILTFFKIWNLIQYYYPYRDKIAVDWNNALDEFLPKFIESPNANELNNSIRELLAKTNDVNTRMSELNYYKFEQQWMRLPPVELTFVENKPVVTGYTQEKFGSESGLELGDIILTINHQSIEEIVKDKIKYVSAPHHQAKLHLIAPTLLKTKDSLLHLEIKRDDKILKKTIITYKIIDIYPEYRTWTQDTSFRLINGDIAYMRNYHTKNENLLKKEKTKGFILDLRSKPYHDDFNEITNFIVSETKPYAIYTLGSKNNPGLFAVGKTSNSENTSDERYQGKIVVLIDESCNMESDIVAMACRSNPNTTLVGSATSGGVPFTSFMHIPGGRSISLMTLGLYYPDGKETHPTGILPDIELRPTIYGIKNHQDELLNKAIEIINKN